MLEWLAAHVRANRVFIPAIAIAEVERGISGLRRRGGLARVAALSAWLDSVLVSFEALILPVNADIARTAGALEDDALGRGHDPGLADVLIAATASTNGLIVLTANKKHFLPLGVEILNPLTDPLPPITGSA